LCREHQQRKDIKEKSLAEGFDADNVTSGVTYEL